MKIFLSIVIVLCVFICAILVFKYNSDDKKQAVTIAETVAIEELTIEDSYKWKHCPFEVKLLQIDNKANKCFLEITNSLSGQKVSFWATPGVSIPEADEFMGIEILMVTEIKEDSVFITTYWGGIITRGN